jgi:hypothetical protein
MKQLSLPVLFVAAVLSSVAVSQTKTVTENDLAKFREKRLNAERDYRENYARLGMPSPEELERRRVEDKKTLVELSDRYRQRDAEQATLEADLAWRIYHGSQSQTIYDVRIIPYRTDRYYSPYFSYGRLPYKFPHRGSSGWRAGGGGVVYEPGGRSSYVWPAPPNPIQRPSHPRQ